MAELERAEIAREFINGRNCAQCVLGCWAEELGYDVEETDKIAACFAGGMLHGDMCGAVTGALMAIGMQFGGDGKEVYENKAVEFETKFKEKCGSLLCRDLLGFDFAKPEEVEKAVESGKLIEYCPTPVSAALDILQEIMG